MEWRPEQGRRSQTRTVSDSERKDGLSLMEITSMSTSHATALVVPPVLCCGLAIGRPFGSRCVMVACQSSQWTVTTDRHIYPSYTHGCDVTVGQDHGTLVMANQYWVVK